MKQTYELSQLSSSRSQIQLSNAKQSQSKGKLVKFSSIDDRDSDRDNLVLRSMSERSMEQLKTAVTKGHGRKDSTQMMLQNILRDEEVGVSKDVFYGS